MEKKIKQNKENGNPFPWACVTDVIIYTCLNFQCHPNSLVDDLSPYNKCLLCYTRGRYNMEINTKQEAECIIITFDSLKNFIKVTFNCLSGDLFQSVTNSFYKILCIHKIILVLFRKVHVTTSLSYNLICIESD